MSLLQQLRADLARALQGLLPAPGLHLGVVAGGEHRRRLKPAPHARLGVARALEQTVGEAVVLVAFGVAQHARDQTRDRFRNDQDGNLAANEHIVADGDLAHAVALLRILEDALVDALVAPAGEHDVLLARPRLRVLLGEGLARRGGHEQQRLAAVLAAFVWTGRDLVDVVVAQLVVAVRGGGVEGCSGAALGDVVKRRPPHLRLHHHARSPAQRRGVHGFVVAGGPVAQVVYAHRQDPLLDRLAQQRLAQRVEVLGKDGDDVEAQLRHQASPRAG